MAPPENTPASTPSLLAQLTPAERLVAVHLVQGLSNKEIAILLDKAEPTIKHQVSAILHSTMVDSRSRLIALYYQQYFCPLPRELPVAAPLTQSPRHLSKREPCGR